MYTDPKKEEAARKLFTLIAVNMKTPKLKDILAGNTICKDWEHTLKDSFGKRKSMLFPALWREVLNRVDEDLADHNEMATGALDWILGVHVFVPDDPEAENLRAFKLFHKRGLFTKKTTRRDWEEMSRLWDIGYSWFQYTASKEDLKLITPW